MPHNEIVRPRLVRQDRRIQPERHDTYKSPRKLAEPTVCPDCHAVYRRGRWRWELTLPKAREHTCPACHRIADDYPAGIVSLRGAFLRQHKVEIINLAGHEESLEKAEHALARIMAFADQDDQLVITTTDIHLARRIGDAVHRAYAGELDYHYEKGDALLRITWTRDA